MPSCSGKGPNESNGLLKAQNNGRKKEDDPEKQNNKWEAFNQWPQVNIVYMFTVFVRLIII